MKSINQVKDQVLVQVSHQVANQTTHPITNQVWHQVREQVLWGQPHIYHLHRMFRNQVRVQVWDQVRDHVEEQVGVDVRLQLWDCFVPHYTAIGINLQGKK